MMKIMLKKIIRPRKTLIFSLPEPGAAQGKDIEKVFARLFSSDDGKRVLAYLQSITFMRAAGMDVSDRSLRYLEGQRSLMAVIVSLIARGRRG